MRLGSWSRWSVPAIAAAAVVAVGATPAAFAGSAHPGLPVKSAAQLLAAVEQSRVRALSGTISTTANLGFPQLPNRIATAGSGLPALLTGNHTLRVWANGRDQQRLALLGDLAETDVVHNGNKLWTYTSITNSVTEQILPPHKGRADVADVAGGDPASPAQALTPQAQAEKALEAIDPSTALSVDRNVRVAKRPAYQLTITPRTAGTLVRSVRIAIDAATFAPLRVQVFAVGGSNPVWQTGFTQISFATPAANVFALTPPRGAKVTTSGSPTEATPGAQTPAAKAPRSASTKPRLIGQGWTTIVELPAGTIDQVPGLTPGGARNDGNSSSVMSLLDRVAKTTPQGRLIATPLLSVLITSDGRVFLGSVPPAAVEAAASSPGA